MKEVSTRYYCDRCGQECTEDVDPGKPTKFYVGLYEILRERLGRSIPHYSGCVYMCLYGDKPGYDSKGEPIILCNSCRESLQAWFKAGE